MMTGLRIAACWALAVLLLPSYSWAGKKDKKIKEPRVVLAPDLGSVLGNAYDVPPELSDRATPGTVLEIMEHGYRTIKTNCVAATPNENPLTNVSMQSSLAGGVSLRLGSIGGGASASQSLSLSFVSPYILGFEMVDFVPSDNCLADLRAYGQRRGGLDGLVLVQEALFARITGCSEVEASGKVSVPGLGGGGVSTTNTCQMFSETPVAVGVRVDLLSHFAGFETEEHGRPTPSAGSVPAGTSTGLGEVPVTSTSAPAEDPTMAPEEKATRGQPGSPRPPGKGLPDSEAGSVSLDAIEILLYTDLSIKKCFASLIKSGHVPPRVDMEFTILPTGHVSSANIQQASWKGTAFEACMRSAVMAVAFPSFSGASQEVTFPFVLDL